MGSVNVPSIRTTASPESAESLRSVLTALAANVTIAMAKGIAAALTGSAALFAETLHTVADAGNEVLLYVSLRSSARPPDALHPFGHGPERYYWALLAAVGIFVVGGAVSIWEGVNALIHPPELAAFWVGVGVLVVAILLDGISRAVAVRQLRRQALRRGVRVQTLLRETADPSIITVYLEDTVDLLGATLALAALILHRVTGSEFPDAIATIAIGLLLTFIAFRLAARNRRLISNQAVPPRYVERLRERLAAEPEIESVKGIEAVYLGPSEVLAAAEVQLQDGMDGRQVARALAETRARVMDEWPVLRRLYLTPTPD